MKFFCWIFCVEERGEQGFDVYNNCFEWFAVVVCISCVANQLVNVAARYIGKSIQFLLNRYIKLARFHFSNI